MDNNHWMKKSIFGLFAFLASTSFAGSQVRILDCDMADSEKTPASFHVFYIPNSGYFLQEEIPGAPYLLQEKLTQPIFKTANGIEIHEKTAYGHAMITRTNPDDWAIDIYLRSIRASFPTGYVCRQPSTDPNGLPK